jgi:hypothetical protein
MITTADINKTRVSKGGFIVFYWWGLKHHLMTNESKKRRKVGKAQHSSMNF